MGILIGIITGIATSIQNSQFRNLPKVSNFFINWFRFVSAFIVAGILVTYFSLWQKLPEQFWIIVAIELPIEVLIAYLYVKAFQLSPQSLVGPLFSLSVIFLIPLSFIFFGTLPSILGFIGIFISLAGSLALGWEKENPGLLLSIKRTLKETGSYYMLLAAFCASITVTLAKYSYKYSPPLLSGFYITLGLAILYSILSINEIKSTPIKHWWPLLRVSIIGGLQNSLHYIGLSMISAPYFISAKRSSVLFDVIIGRFVHKEENFKMRLIGSLCMIVGLVLIALA